MSRDAVAGVNSGDICAHAAQISLSLVSGFSEVLQCVRTTEGKKRKPQGSEKIKTWQINEKKTVQIKKKTPATFMARDEEIYQEKLANFQRKNGTSRRKFYENKLANFQVKKL